MGEGSWGKKKIGFYLKTPTALSHAMLVNPGCGADRVCGRAGMKPFLLSRAHSTLPGLFSAPPRSPHAPGEISDTRGAFQCCEIPSALVTSGLQGPCATGFTEVKLLPAQQGCSQLEACGGKWGRGPSRSILCEAGFSRETEPIGVFLHLRYRIGLRGL